jgi:hypothetical protein
MIEVSRTMAKHVGDRSSNTAAPDRARWADGACLGRRGIRRVAVPVLLFCASCNSQRSPPVEQRDEPLSKGQTEPRASTAGQSHATPLERQASVSPEPGPQLEGGGAKSPSPADLKKALRSMPDSVLVGTDVIPLSELLKSARPIIVPETFRSEQGGATAEIQLVKGLSGAVLTRQFAEPGTEVHSKRYDSLSSSSDGVRLSSSALEVLGLQDAILVLERSSGVDGIPGSLWIRYDKARPGGSEDRRR